MNEFSLELDFELQAAREVYGRLIPVNDQSPLVLRRLFHAAILRRHHEIVEDLEMMSGQEVDLPVPHFEIGRLILQKGSNALVGVMPAAAPAYSTVLSTVSAETTLCLANL